MNHDKHEDEYEVDEYDELDFEDEEYDGGLLRILSIVFVLAAVCGFIALAWYAYKSGMQPVSEDEIPMVAADTEPFKEKPEDPGGLQFEHQDKSVYNQLATGEGEQRPMAERLLPPPEEPVERAQPELMAPEEFRKEPVETIAAAKKDSVDTPIPATQSKAAAEKETTKEVVAKPIEKPAEEVTPPKEEPVAVIERKAPDAKPTPAPAVVASPSAAKAGQYMAQLGAFGSAEDADAAWTKINTAHGSMFPTKRHTLQRAEVNGKTYHRLQVGPFDSETSARKVCDYLQQNKQACFVVSVK